MRFLLIALLTLISFSAMANTSGEQWPRGCSRFKKPCEGWMFYYERKPDKFGNVFRNGDIGYFVPNKQLTSNGEFAKTPDDARAVADQHMLTNNNPGRIP